MDINQCVASVGRHIGARMRDFLNLTVLGPIVGAALVSEHVVMHVRVGV